MIVVDVNVLVHLRLAGPGYDEAVKVAAKDAEWVAPVLWEYEFRNVLCQYLQFKQMSLPEAVDLMSAAHEFMGEGYECPSRELVLRMAQDSGCTAYDCEYAALAEHLQVPLVTMDKKILKQFPHIAFSPQAFLKAV